VRPLLRSPPCRGAGAQAASVTTYAHRLPRETSIYVQATNYSLSTPSDRSLISRTALNEHTHTTSMILFWYTASVVLVPVLLCVLCVMNLCRRLGSTTTSPQLAIGCSTGAAAHLPLHVARHRKRGVSGLAKPVGVAGKSAFCSTRSKG
jgi:hypothetical protein